MLLIRPACEADLPAITTIYGHHVLHGTGTFELEPPSVADMGSRWADVRQRQLPWLVAIQDGLVLGYAYCNWFRPRAAFRFCAEDSIYLAPQAQRQGLGRALLAELMHQAQQVGIRRLVAVIGDSANAGSIGLHRALGFRPAGVIPACGYKHERWLDIVLMERDLGQGDTTRPSALPPPSR